MLAQHLEEAITSAPTRNLDDLGKAMWAAWGKGALTDAEAEKLGQAIEARRAASRARQSTPGPAPGRPSIFPPRKLQRARPHPERIPRRRRLAASGPLPPQLAAQFTTGELAVLKIVSAEVRQKGACTRPLAEIAARAGVCRSLAQACIRRAARLGLLEVQERKQAHRPHLPNLLRITSAEWRAWLKLGPHKGEGRGSRNLNPTGKEHEKGQCQPASEGRKGALEERKRGVAPPS